MRVKLTEKLQEMEKDLQWCDRYMCVLDEDEDVSGYSKLKLTPKGWLDILGNHTLEQYIQIFIAQNSIGKQSLEPRHSKSTESRRASAIDASKSSPLPQDNNKKTNNPKLGHTKTQTFQAGVPRTPQQIQQSGTVPSNRNTIKRKRAKIISNNFILFSCIYIAFKSFKCDMPLKKLFFRISNDKKTGHQRHKAKHKTNKKKPKKIS
ncbi:hypothetical protein RFI_30841 [Reticulomyxa filosa]|uniref:Uncharacterized protein n=1 Tax=Reticulomyxa filosa TaxID=46433 RepID=X6LYX0_RETFI|nr:hypothetical protein RFI_30841 [Reticulomyxa filosa]|eukprot:ETO06551.1 hypothetical protein RFI_30841 [Reticulomyxa filosa]